MPVVIIRQCEGIVKCYLLVLIWPSSATTDGSNVQSMYFLVSTSGLNSGSRIQNSTEASIRF
jgi:hypothetical protein